MQSSSSKKRKIDPSPEREGDDWGDDLTAADFDLLETQAVAPSKTCPSQSLIPNIHQHEKLLEEQLVQEGQIHILRQLLEQKSKELEEERRERDNKIQLCLENCHETEQKLLSEKLSLQSAIQFKDHELNLAQEKIKLLEQKCSKSCIVASVSSSCVMKRTSPSKVPLNIPANCFTSFPHRFHSSTQTDTKISNQSLLIYNSVYTNFKCVVPNKNTIPKTKLPMPCKANSENCTSFKNVFTKHVSAQINEERSLEMQCTCMPCYCSDKTFSGLPNKEMEMLKSIDFQLRKYVESLPEMENQYQSTTFSNSFSTKLKQDATEEGFPQHALHLANLCAVLDASMSTRFILVSSLKQYLLSFPQHEKQNSKGFGDLLILVAKCTIPILYDNQIINENIVNWSLTALIIVCIHFKQCCCNLFENVVDILRLNELLNSRCSFKTTYLVLKLLVCLVGIRATFTHREVVCIFSSIGEHINSFLFPSKCSNQQVQLIVLCVHFLTAVICYHGVPAIYSNQCACLTKILSPIFTWIYENELTDDSPTLLKILQLIQILLRYLDSAKRAELCSRLGDSYILMMNKLCRMDLDDSCASLVKDLVKEL